MSKKLKIPANRYWKAEIDYSNKLSKEEKEFLHRFNNTEYSNAPHDEYSGEDMKKVYGNTNSANRCLISNSYNPNCPDTVHDGEVLGRGKDYDDVILDMNNIIEDHLSDFRDIWVRDFNTAHSYLIDDYKDKPLSETSLMQFFIKMNQLLRWERIDRKNVKHSDNNPESLDS